MEKLWPIISSVLGVFVVMALGAFCRRRGWLTHQADESLAKLTTHLLLPAYLLNKIIGGESYESVLGSWAPPLFGFAFTALSFGLSYAFARTVGVRFGLDTDAKQRAFGLCAGIANYGYIPLPLAERFYESALVELILHNVGVELALWSVGIAIVSGSGQGWKSALRSPPLVAVVLAITLRELGWVPLIPSPLLTAAEALGSCAIPTGLLLSGAIIVDFLRGIRSWGGPRVMLAAIGLRQGLFPMLMLLVASAWVTSPDLDRVVMLQAAMPAAVFPIVLVRMYGRDIETALRVVLATSLTGVVLIPAWLAAAAWWLGL